MCEAMSEGLEKAGVGCERREFSTFDGKGVPSVSSGILGGIDQVFKSCRYNGVEWWCLDNGFFKHRHYDGYYRIGYCHLQPRFNKNASVSASRWEALKLPVKPWKINPNGHIIVCPPSIPLCWFYGENPKEWIDSVVARIPVQYRDRVVVRTKQDRVKSTAQEAYKNAKCVIVHSSRVGVEALQDGIPAIADRGTLAGWSGFGPEQIDEDFTKLDRNRLFHYMAWCQFTLREIRAGVSWKALFSLQAEIGVPLPERIPEAEPWKWDRLPCHEYIFPHKDKDHLNVCARCGKGHIVIGMCWSFEMPRHCKACCTSKNKWVGRGPIVRKRKGELRGSKG